MTVQSMAKAIAANNAAVGSTGRFTARLGKGDGQGAIISANALWPNTVNWHIIKADGDGSSTGTAILDDHLASLYANNPDFEKIEVAIGKKPGSTELWVLDTTLTGTLTTGGIAPIQQQINAVGNPSVAGLTDFRVQPTASASLEVSVAPGVYTKPSDRSRQIWAGGDTSQATTTLTSLQVALTSGQHRLAYVCFDYENAVIVVVAGAAASTAASTLGTAASRSEFDVTDFTGISITSTYKPLIPVYLYYGQTSIAEADIYRTLDQRLDFPIPTAYMRFVTAPAATGSSGTAGDVAYDASFFYVCTAANTWKRVAIATW